MQNTTIYSLFIAINEYQNIRNLKGCENDANNLSTYIKEAAHAQSRTVNHLQLVNSEATKKNITKAFIQHFAQAGEEDICLFYFSGHGGQEEAPPQFQQYEPEGKLEVLACCDSDHNKKGSFLADKELRYLIYQIYTKTKAEIITIFDCCNSGDNTRNNLEVRQLNKVVSSRSMDDFIFPNFSSQRAIDSSTLLGDLLPIGKHIHLAACENKQSAYERDGSGIFTSNLLTLLRQTKGDISYHNLINILRLKIDGHYDQTPQLFAVGDQDQLNHSFLGGLIRHQKELANVVYNSKSSSWVMDMGAIHGLSVSNPNLSITLQTTPPLPISPIKVLPNKTNVFIENSQELDKDKSYQASIQGIISKPIPISIEGEKEAVKSLNNYIEEHPTKMEGLSFGKDTNLATYILVGDSKKYSLLSAKDRQPVSAGWTKDSPNSLKKLANDLQTIVKWNYVLELNNPHTSIYPNPPLSIEFIQTLDNKEEEVLPIQNNTVQLPYTKTPSNPTNENLPTGNVKIKITNSSNKPYYCALLFLTPNFEIVTNFLVGNTIELPPQREAWVYEGAIISLKQENHVRLLNQEREVEYLKLIVSTSTFDISSLQQKGLPYPFAHEEISEETRGFDLSSPLEKDDWTSQLIKICLPNPYYQNE